MNRGSFLNSNWIFKIIIINLIVFLFQLLQKNSIIPIFALIPSRVINDGMVWQVFTYMFLHGNFLHFIINMYMLFIFGQAIEEVWGSKKFIQYYLFCGVGAGISILIIGYLTRETGSSAFYLPTIGASGAVFGILLAFAMLFPNVEILLLIPPIPIKAKYLVILYGAMELFFELNKSMDNISHIGHLGGLVFGLIYFFTIHKIRPAHTRKFNSKLKSAHNAAKQTEKEKVFSEDNNLTVKKNIIKKLQKSSNIDDLTDDEYQYIKYLDIMVDTENIKYKNESDILSKKRISDIDFLMEVKKYISFSDN